MRYSLSVKTAPGGEPITLAEARVHLRADDSVTDEDALIRALITAAREWVENYCRRSLVLRTYELRMDCFPAEIRLPRAPVASLTHIKYTDQGGSLTELAASQYQADLYSEPARIIPAFGAVWPTPKFGTLNAVLIEYVAGYTVGSPDNDYGENVPQAIKAAMLLIVGHLMENRELTSEKALMEVPFAVKQLLAPFELRDYTLE